MTVGEEWGCHAAGLVKLTARCSNSKAKAHDCGSFQAHYSSTVLPCTASWAKSSWSSNADCGGRERMGKCTTVSYHHPPSWRRSLIPHKTAVHRIYGHHYWSFRLPCAKAHTQCIGPNHIRGCPTKDDLIRTEAAPLEIHGGIGCPKLLGGGNHETPVSPQRPSGVYPSTSRLKGSKILSFNRSSAIGDAWGAWLLNPSRTRSNEIPGSPQRLVGGYSCSAENYGRSRLANE